MKAVVMAGGEGTRLRPLTSNQPKPMVSVVGKPCMEHIVELLKRHGMEEGIVTLAFTMVTHQGTDWPYVLFWVGLGMAGAAAVDYVVNAWREVKG